MDRPSDNAIARSCGLNGIILSPAMQHMLQ
jgi:hypothetical protein